MLKLKKVIYVILLLHLSTSAQNSTISLLDSTYDYLSNKYYEFKFIDSTKAKNYADVYLKKAQTEKDTINIIDGYSYLSEVSNDETIYTNYLDSIIEVTKNKPSKMFPAYAYMIKGRDYLINNKNDKALKNFLLGIKFCDKNDSLKYLIHHRISILKYRNKNFTEAKKLSLESYFFFDKFRKYRDNSNYGSILLSISSSYLGEKKYDSSFIFSEKSFDFANKINDFLFVSLSLYKKGEIYFYKKKYSLAIENIKKAIPGIIDDENYIILSKSYNYIAKSYAKLGSTHQAFKYNKLIDSLSAKTTIIFNAQRNSYNFLIKHYKEKNDVQNQLKYINKFLKVDSILNVRGTKLSETFTEEYDIPNLIAEKETIINELKGNLTYSQKVKYAFIGLSVLTLFLLWYQIRKRKILKRRFDEFIKTQDTNNTTSTAIVVKEDLNIPKDIVDSVLTDLEKFEKKKHFTNINLTLNKLATSLNTNTNYLSKIINHYKDKNFSNYVKDLRIDFTLELLNKNKQLRKYTIKAIANEVGFNTAESFSSAFYKKTGLKPSYYIKELNKRKDIA